MDVGVMLVGTHCPLLALPMLLGTSVCRKCRYVGLEVSSLVMYFLTTFMAMFMLSECSQCVCKCLWGAVGHRGSENC